MIRVAVVASSTAARAGLHALLSADAELEVLGQAPRLSELSPQALAGEVLVVMADPSPPEDLLERLGQLHDPPALLLITEERAAARALRELPLRVWGLLLPDAAQEELAAAIHALSEGLAVADPLLLEAVLPSPEAARADEEIREAPFVTGVTNREVEVLQLVGQGLANKQIAEALSISPHTVKYHISSIYAKLGATNRAEAVRLGIQYGLVAL